MRFSKSVWGAAFRAGATATGFLGALLTDFLPEFLRADRAGTFLVAFAAFAFTAGFFAVLGAALRVRA